LQFIVQNPPVGVFNLVSHQYFFHNEQINMKIGILLSLNPQKKTQGDQVIFVSIVSFKTTSSNSFKQGQRIASTVLQTNCAQAEATAHTLKTTTPSSASNPAPTARQVVCE